MTTVVLGALHHGTIEVNSRLSGMPDISMSLSNSHLIEEYSFHPSVRLSRHSSTPHTASTFQLAFQLILRYPFWSRFVTGNPVRKPHPKPHPTQP